MRTKKQSVTAIQAATVAPLPEPDQLKDINWVANFLQVSKTHVFHLKKHEGLPFIKCGHLLRFHPHAVVRWAEEKQQQSA